MSTKKIARKKTPAKRPAPRPKKTAKPTANEIDFDDPEVQRKLGAAAVRQAREPADANARVAAMPQPAWDGAGRFRSEATAEQVLRETFASAHVDSADVLEQAVNRAVDELGVLELALENESLVNEAVTFVERVQHGLIAALWLHQREAKRAGQVAS